MATPEQMFVSDATGNRTAYNVLIYLDGMEDSTPQGMRMCYLSWKANPSEGKKALSVPRCVFVPILSVSVTPDVLQKAVREALESIQDKQIRTSVEADIKASKPVSPISVTFCSPSELSRMYSEQNVSTTRLSKESIAAWFDASLADKLTLALAAKSGLDMATVTQEQLAPMVAASNQHRSYLEKLAAPGFTVAPQKALQLIKAVRLSDDCDASKIANSLLTKLDRMSIVEPLDSFGL